MIYLDNNATTAVAPEVRDAMLPWLGEGFGNPSSNCTPGREAKKAIDHAREQIATFLQVSPEEIIFTSGGTESNNAAIHSALLSQPGKNHIVTSTVEHSAILDYLRTLEKRGIASFTAVGVDAEGQLDLNALDDAIRPETALVSIMWANNETGILSPINEAAEIAARHSVPFHSDAINAAAKTPLDVRSQPIHFLSLSGHKFHAPKGVGALFVRSGLAFEPLLIGGGQESGRRSGTEAVPSIAALGNAAEMGADFLHNDGINRLQALRDQLETSLLENITGLRVTGSSAPRLPNTSHFSIEGIRSDELVLLLESRGLCASTGSACSTGERNPSHVLTAMGFDRSRAHSSLRLSLSRYTTDTVVNDAAKIIHSSIERMRSLT